MTDGGPHAGAALGGETADPCADGTDYCTVRTCFGHDFGACMAEREAACPTVCDHIEVEAGHCPGFGYECADHSEDQSWCFHAVLIEHEDPCFLFSEPDILCAGGVPSIEGDASCKIQECFGVESYLDCYERLQAICPYQGG